MVTDLYGEHMSIAMNSAVYEVQLILFIFVH